MILDTNALSAIADSDPSILPHLEQAGRLAIPVIVLAEYRLGILQSRLRAVYEGWLKDWLTTVAVLPIDEETTLSYAAIGFDLKKKGKPIPANDLWIAALCRQHALPLLSRDHHFDVVPALRRVIW